MKAVLEFGTDNLLYDIRNNGYIEGHLRGEDEQEAKHLLEDICEQGNRDRVMRTLGLLHAAAADLLYPYTKHAAEGSVLRDDLAEPDVWRIEMEVPEGYSQTTLELLVRLLHEWLVYKVLFDWLSTVWPEKSAVWREKAEDIEGEIRGCVNARMGRSRIKLHPF